MKTLAFTAIACLAVAAQAQTLDPNATVLTVNGHRINASEYFNRMEFLDGVGTVNAGRFVEAPPAFLTVQRLVNERLILELAREKGVAPTQAEIDAEFNGHKAQSPERFQRLSELGVSEAEIKHQLAVELAQFKLVTMGVTITDAQVNDHYDLNKMVYTRPATVKLRVIVVREAADKSKVDNELRTKSFEAVAREHSTDLTKFDGGDLPVVPAENLPPHILDAVRMTKVGQSTAWMESQGAHVKYLVESKEDSAQLPLDDKLRNSIRRNMMLVAGQQKNNVHQQLEERRRTAKIEITSPGLQRLWDLYINAGRATPQPPQS